MADLRIVAVPRDENDILVDDRLRLSGWAPSNDWTYLEYGDGFELLASIADVRSPRIEIIEIVAHGNPLLCDDVVIGNAALLGVSLRRLTGIGEHTSVYLSGCNTGLELNADCIARSFSEAFEGSVFGARGYLAGTYAERNERCVASFELDGIVYHAYPGGVDAEGSAVWKHFGHRSPRSGGDDDMQIKIATSGFRAVNLTDSQGQDLVSAVEQLVQTPGAISARMRMAPDLTFAVRLADGEHVFELLAGGTVLRDPVTKHVWQFERGREVLLRLLPYRKLPAA
jgi:hypothetical protein